MNGPVDAGAYARLVSGKRTKEWARDYAAYLRTDHWASLKKRAVEWWTEFLGGRLLCLICERRATVWHHVPSGYRNLFREDVARHLRPLCQACHKRYEKGKRR